MRVEIRALAEFVVNPLVGHRQRPVQLVSVNSSLEPRHHLSDVAILDTPALDTSAAERVQSFRARFRHLPLLVLDGGLVAEERARVLDAGADSILKVPCTPAELIAHVHALARQREAARQFAAACVAARLPHARLATLTKREVEVLRLLAQGRTDQEIANDLQIGVRTARFHVGSILRKCLAHNRAHAAAYGALVDLLEVEFAIAG